MAIWSFSHCGRRTDTGYRRPETIDFIFCPMLLCSALDRQFMYAVKTVYCRVQRSWRGAHAKTSVDITTALPVTQPRERLPLKRYQVWTPRWIAASTTRSTAQVTPTRVSATRTSHRVSRVVRRATILVGYSLPTIVATTTPTPACTSALKGSATQTGTVNDFLGQELIPYRYSSCCCCCCCCWSNCLQ